MSTVRVTKEFQGISADEAYTLAENALEASGLEIWKRRPLAWLIMADLNDDNGTIRGNVACRPGNGASITITLDSEDHDEPLLSSLVEKFFETLDQR